MAYASNVAEIYSANSLTNIAFARVGPKLNSRSQRATLARYEDTKPQIAVGQGVNRCHVISRAKSLASANRDQV